MKIHVTDGILFFPKFHFLESNVEDKIGKTKHCPGNPRASMGIEKKKPSLKGEIESPGIVKCGYCLRFITPMYQNRKELILIFLYSLK